MGRVFGTSLDMNNRNNVTADITDKYLGTSYMLLHKKDFEPGRSSDFIFKVKFARDLYDMDGTKVATAADASETLALSLRDLQDQV